MVMDMKNFRWPGILHVNIRVRVVSFKGSWAILPHVGHGFAESSNKDDYSWRFFTLQKNGPYYLNYIWEGK